MAKKLADALMRKPPPESSELATLRAQLAAVTEAASSLIEAAVEYTDGGIYHYKGSDGNLKDVRYIEDKSSPSYYLKDVSMRSIREAAPFPAFPNDLDYPQLSFNVIISFQIDGENG